MEGFSRSSLAFDTALGGCVVACVAAGGRPATRVLRTDRDQAAKLIPLIQDCMEEAGVTFDTLEGLVTTIGPGSFTGLRIGLSTARALALALDIPLIGVTTLEVAARQALRASAGAPVCVLLETKRSDYYGQLFDAQGHAVSEPAAQPADEFAARLSGHHLFGDAVSRFVAETGYAGPVGEIALLDPLNLLAAGAQKQPGAKLEPLYLRGADVSQPKSPPRVAQGLESLLGE